MANKRWKTSDLRKLKDGAKGRTMKELAEFMGVSYSTVYRICKEQGISVISEKPRWSKEVKTFILENTHLSCHELALRTGHNQDSIRHLLCSVYGPRWRFFMKRNLNKEE